MRTEEQAPLSRSPLPTPAAGLPTLGLTSPSAQNGDNKPFLGCEVSLTAEIKDPSVWKQCCCLVQALYPGTLVSPQSLLPAPLLCPLLPCWHFFSGLPLPVAGGQASDHEVGGERKNSNVCIAGTQVF